MELLIDTNNAAHTRRRSRKSRSEWGGHAVCGDGTSAECCADGAKDGRRQFRTQNAAVSPQDKAAQPACAETHELRHAQKDGQYYAGGMGVAPAKDHAAMPA